CVFSGNVFRRLESDEMEASAVAVEEFIEYVVLLSNGCELPFVVRTVWEFVRRVGVGSDAFTDIFVLHICCLGFGYEDQVMSWLIVEIIGELLWLENLVEMRKGNRNERKIVSLTVGMNPTIRLQRKKMDLFAFIRHSDPTKVRIGERDLVEREVKLLKMTEGRTVSLDPLATAASRGSGDSIDKLFDEEDDASQEHYVKKDDDILDETIARDVSDVAVEKAKKKQKRKLTRDASGSTHPPKKLSDDYRSALPNTSRKSLATLRGLVPDGSGIPSGVTELLIAAFVAPTPDVGPMDFVFGLNLRTCHPNMRYLVADAPVVTVAVTTTVFTNVVAMPGSKARVESKNLENVGDYASSGGANADAANQLYSEFNVEAARQVCLGLEVRMRAEHTLEKKGELEDKCAEQASLLSERDTEIVHPKSLLSLKEVEAAEAIRLCGQLATVKAVDAAKDNELKDLKEKNFTLEGERCYMSSLESAFELFSARMKATQDEQKRVLGTAIGCAVNKGIQDGPRVGVDHGKAVRDLSVIEAYDPFAEAKYVEAVNALGAVDFFLLFELKSKKDASIVDLMDSLRLEGPLAEIPRAEDLQPVQRVKGEITKKRLSLTDVMAPLAEPFSSRSLISKASTSGAPTTTASITTLSITLASFDVIPPLATSNDQALDA
nr:hypothetical protein [Tanacetum cinerariifolium]